MATAVYRRGERANMKRIEKLIFALIFGSSLPILCGMIAVILWSYLNYDANVALYFALAGLTAGLLLDGIYLKKLINNAFDLPIGLLVAFYINPLAECRNLCNKYAVNGNRNTDPTDGIYRRMKIGSSLRCTLE
jgi:uncharacterized membrane protein